MVHGVAGRRRKRSEALQVAAIMPVIPHTPELDASLRALAIESTAGRTDGLILLEPRRMARPGAPHLAFTVEQTATLVHEGAAPVSVEALRNRVAKGLARAHGNAYDAAVATELARLVLGMLAILPGSERLAALNDLLENTPTARVASWLILPNRATAAGEYVVGDFRYAVLDDTIRSRWERAGATDWSAFQDRLVGRLAISRDREIRLIDPHRLTDRREAPAGPAQATFHALVDEFFGSVAVAEQARFREDLERAQRVLRAAGLGGVRDTTFLQIAAAGDRVTIFTRAERRRGWVVPEWMAPVFHAPLPRVLRDGAVDIMRALELDDWGARPLDPVIERYAQYVVRARDDGDAGDTASAMLHLIFGLDFLLGGAHDQKLTTTLAARVATLAARACGKTQESVEKSVARLYDTRSEYVHRGGMDVGVDPAAYSDLLRLAFACLGAAAHARRRPWAGPDAKTARDTWMQRVDLAGQHARVHGEPTIDDLRELGVDRVELLDGAVCRVVLREPSR
jgi:hypothetical protein